MLHRSPAEVQETAQRMARLGVDRVRLTASWFHLAPRPRSKRVPRFDATNSEAYPREAWSHLDRAVKAATNADLDVADGRGVLRPALGCRTRGPDQLPRPAPVEARPRAVRAIRRGGRAPLQRRPPRPRAFRASAFRPSGSGRPGTSRTTALSFFRSGDAAAALGSRSRRTSTASCTSAGTRRSRASTRRTRSCSEARPPWAGMAAAGARRSRRSSSCASSPASTGVAVRSSEPHVTSFRPLQADGWAHHPYSLYDRPDVASLKRDDVQMGDLERLSRVLDAAALTRPDHDQASDLPDRVRLRDEPAGRDARSHARRSRPATTGSRHISRGSSRTSRCSRSSCSTTSPHRPARSNDPEEASRDWHSGLYFHDGRPKEPAIQAFKIPFWAEARSLAGQDVVVLFGQVRPTTAASRWRSRCAAPTAPGSRSRPTRHAQRATPRVAQEATSFLTDTEGFYQRIAPYQGPTMLPRALDQDRRDLRVRRGRSRSRARSARLLTDDDLHPHLRADGSRTGSSRSRLCRTCG